MTPMTRILAAALILSIAASASAQTIIDQQYLTNGNPRYILDYPGDYLAQTFTLQSTGRLVAIGVQAILPPDTRLPPTDDILVRLVRTTTTGAPEVGQLLASRTIARQDVPASLSASEAILVDVAAESIQVRAGDVLALLVSSDHTYYSHPSDYQQYRFHMSFVNPHPDGDFYIYSPQLWGPEPFLIRDGFDPPNNTRDLGFQVFVRIPEPSSAAILGAGALVAGAQRVRNHRRRRP